MEFAIGVLVLGVLVVVFAVVPRKRPPPSGDVVGDEKRRKGQDVSIAGLLILGLSLVVFGVYGVVINAWR
jgi:hypothetical protein